jgi:hypothetical protein
VHWAEFALSPDAQCVAHACGVGSAHVHSACAARVRRVAHGTSVRAAHGTTALLGEPATTRRRRTGERGGWNGTAAVRATARLVRQLSGRRLGRARRKRGALLGRASRGPDSV